MRLFTFFSFFPPDGACATGRRKNALSFLPLFLKLYRNLGVRFSPISNEKTEKVERWKNTAVEFYPSDIQNPFSPSAIELSKLTYVSVCCISLVLYCNASRNGSWNFTDSGKKNNNIVSIFMRSILKRRIVGSYLSMLPDLISHTKTDGFPKKLRLLPMLTKNENEAKNALGKHSWKRSAIFSQTTLLLSTLFFWQTVFTPPPLLWIHWRTHTKHYPVHLSGQFAPLDPRRKRPSKHTGL